MPLERLKRVAICDLLADYPASTSSTRDSQNGERASFIPFANSCHFEKSVSKTVSSCQHRSSNMAKILWTGAESNCRHTAFQAVALPTELPVRKFRNLANERSE